MDIKHETGVELSYCCKNDTNQGFHDMDIMWSFIFAPLLLAFFVLSSSLTIFSWILEANNFLFYFHIWIGTLYFLSLINFLPSFKNWRDNLIKILQPCVVSNHLDDNQIGCYDYFATIISSYVAIHVRCSLMNMICVAIQQHIEAWSTFDVNLY